MQKKDYNPLLNNCDNLIEEYIGSIVAQELKSMSGAIGQGLKSMVSRYASFSSLSLKIKEFFKVLLHPSKHASDTWDDQLLKNSMNVKDELSKVKIRMQVYSHQHRINELDDLAKTNSILSGQLDHIRKTFIGQDLTNKLDDLFVNTMGVDGVKNQFHSTVNQIHLTKDGMYLDIYDFINFIDTHTAEEIVHNIKAGGAGSFLSDGIVKLGSGLDSHVVLASYSYVLGRVCSGIYGFFNNKPILDSHVSDQVIQTVITPQLPEQPILPHHAIDHHNYGELAGGLAIGLSGYALYKYLKSRKESGF